MFKNEVAISTFPDWLANQLLHRHIPFRVNLAESDYLFNRLAYADTLSRDVDLLTRFTVTKSGKIKNCVIENLTDEEFTDEVVVLYLYPENGKLLKWMERKRLQINNSQYLLA